MLRNSQRSALGSLQAKVPGQEGSRAERRRVKHGGNDIPVLHGGQRWKCINAQCADEPYNVESGIPDGVVMKDPNTGRDIIFCRACFGRLMPSLMRFLPQLAPWDPNSDQPFDVQLREIREKLTKEREEAAEKKYQEMVAKGEAPAGDDMKAAPVEVPVSNEARAAAAGLELAHA